MAVSPSSASRRNTSPFIGCRSHTDMKINKLRKTICRDMTFCQESGTDESGESVCTVPHPCIYRPKHSGSDQFETCTPSQTALRLTGSSEIDLERAMDEVMRVDSMAEPAPVQGRSSASIVKPTPLQQRTLGLALR